MSETPYSLAVAAEVRAWLGRRGLNQRQLAERTGTNEIWISRRLHGKTSIDVEDLAKFALALDVPISDLLPRLAPPGDTRRYRQLVAA